jgi:dipeptidyl aminopeptidase/acylaminoacyl peptidase
MSRWHEPAPGEHDAGDRSWDVVRQAYEERLPTPRERSRRPLVAVAAGVAILAAALSPPGLAVWGSLRDAVRGAQNTKPALFSLPTPRSRLLVNSAEGAWVVQSDGSKRLLDGYRDASWSPHGLYLAAIHGDELRALEPNGNVHWSIGRAGLQSPRWSSQGHGDERVAYLAGSTLRVVGGDGRGDRALARHVSPVVPAWLPRTHVLAYVNGAGRLVVHNVDNGTLRWSAPLAQRPKALEWSGDGRYLLVRGASSLTVFGSTGTPRLYPIGPGAAPIVDAAFQPGSDAVAFVQHAGNRSVVWFYPRLRPDGTSAQRVIAVAGVFDRVAWSPDARWLLLSWRSADEWLFIRSASVRKVVPVSGIADNFGPAAVPAGWCCP